MKTLWTTIALVGFISVSLFGLLLIQHQGGHAVECLASQLNGSNAPCPEADPLGFASFHSNALKKISNLIVINGAATSYLIILLAISMSGSMLFLSDNKFSIEQIKFSCLELLTTSYSLLAIRLAWFSLHENSPSFFKG